MKGYMDLLLKLGHKEPSALQLFPHKCKNIKYGAKKQISPDKGMVSPLGPDWIRRFR